MTKLGGLLLAAFALVATPLSAQDYPNKPVRVIASSGVGGLSDTILRSLGDELHKRWGQPLVIETRPGGSFNIGARACAEAPADGYTICFMSHEPIVYNQFLFKSLSFDPVAGIAPVTNVGFVTQALVANATLNVKSVDELVAYAKARPKTLSYTAPAPPLVLFMDNLNRQHGLDLVRVPFKSGGDAVNGVLSNVTPITFVGLGNVISHLRGGLMNGLIVDGDVRSPLFPDVTAIKEIGYREPLTRSYFAFYAPAGTPLTLRQKIAADVRAVASDPAFRDRTLIQRGLEPELNSPEAFGEFLARDRAGAKQVVEASGLQPQ